MGLYQPSTKLKQAIFASDWKASGAASAARIPASRRSPTLGGNPLRRRLAPTRPAVRVNRAMRLRPCFAPPARGCACAGRFAVPESRVEARPRARRLPDDAPEDDVEHADGVRTGGNRFGHEVHDDTIKRRRAGAVAETKKAVAAGEGVRSAFVSKGLLGEWLGPGPQATRLRAPDPGLNGRLMKAWHYTSGTRATRCTGASSALPARMLDLLMWHQRLSRARVRWLFM